MGKAGGSARGPRLPKRSVIERLTKQPPQCVQEMMSMLTCFKESNYDEARCAQQMRALNECVGRQKQHSVKQKSTVFFHLKRLFYLQRSR
jgi:hypothetical protein